MIWFTADTHLEHANIILYARPQFLLKDSIENGCWTSREAAVKCANTMADIFIINWNSVVEPKDSVYILGDFIWMPYSKKKGRDRVDYYLNRLNGKKLLIQGNHDHIKYYRDADIKWLGPYYELHFYHRLFILSHYPFQSWNKSNYGSIHLHGHSHGKLNTIVNRFDVGVDACNYKPISIINILEAATDDE